MPVDPDLPAELAGVLTGVLLIAAIGMGQLAGIFKDEKSTDEAEMKNSQLAVLSAVILALLFPKRCFLHRKTLTLLRQALRPMDRCNR